MSIDVKCDRCRADITHATRHKCTLEQVSGHRTISDVTNAAYDLCDPCRVIVKDNVVGQKQHVIVARIVNTARLWRDTQSQASEKASLEVEDLISAVNAYDEATGYLGEVGSDDCVVTGPTITKINDD